MADIILLGVRALARSPLYRLGPARRVIDKFAGNPRELSRFVKFGIVGTIGAVIDYTILILLHERVGLALWTANTVSFSVAVLSNFTWNRLWTFPESRQRPIRRQLPQFALVNLIGLGINEAVLLSLEKFVTTPLLGPRPGYIVAKAVAILIVLFWNFGINRIWTYKGL
jgi:putative flippase GtrA